MPNVHGFRTTSGRRVNARRDPSGQLIIDQDEDNLSDKEMYARNVPAIGEAFVEEVKFSQIYIEHVLIILVKSSEGFVRINIRGGS